MSGLEDIMLAYDAEKHQLLNTDTLKGVLIDLDVVELYISSAISCPHAFFLAMRTKDGYKVVYSGGHQAFLRMKKI